MWMTKAQVSENRCTFIHAIPSACFLHVIYTTVHNHIWNCAFRVNQLVFSSFVLEIKQVDIFHLYDGDLSVWVIMMLGNITATLDVVLQLLVCVYEKSLILVKER